MLMIPMASDATVGGLLTEALLRAARHAHLKDSAFDRAEMCVEIDDCLLSEDDTLRDLYQEGDVVAIKSMFSSSPGEQSEPVGTATPQAGTADEPAVNQCSLEPSALS